MDSPLHADGRDFCKVENRTRAGMKVGMPLRAIDNVRFHFLCWNSSRRRKPVRVRRGRATVFGPDWVESQTLLVTDVKSTGRVIL